MLKGTNLNYTKAYNYRIVLEMVRLNGPISRSDIAQSTGLTVQTVANISNRLLSRKLIKEGERKTNGRGAPSTALEVNPKGALSIGIDFNRDHLTAVLVDLAGKVKAKVFFELNSPEPEKAVELIASSIDHLIKHVDVNLSEMIGVGIGLPGPLEIIGNEVVTNAVNPKLYPKWNHVPIVEMIGKHTKLPIFLENNASSAAIGERWYGEGKAYTNFVYAFFGIGFGSGIIINGQLYNGNNRNAGEIGFFPIDAKMSPLSVDPKPHLGEHFNINSLYDWLDMNGVKASEPEDLLTLFQRKNPFLMEWLNTGIQLLGSAFTSVEYLLDPEAIILGGRLPTPILSFIKDGLDIQLRQLRVLETQRIPDLLTTTAGADAAALGAATLPMFNIFAANPEILLKKEDE